MTIAADEPGPAVEIAGTHGRSLQSRQVGQEYRLSISLPAAYEDSGQRFPVLYLLDAQWDFPLVHSIYGEQYYDGFLPGLIIVGIGWGGASPDVDRLRRRDFTPTEEGGDGHSGGAQRFLAFLEHELLPFIEQNYRASGDRALLGSSLGGLFCLYALFQRPDLFDRYIATSPATPWDGNAIYGFADGFAARVAAHPARLYLAVGELEDLYAPVQELVEWLARQSYGGLTWTSHVVSGAGHSGVKAEGNARGLQFAWQRPDLLLSATQLKPFIGDFQSVDGLTAVQLTFRDGRLWAHLPDSGRDLEFRAETPDRFYRRGEFLKVTFDRDGQDQAAGFAVERYQGTERFVRVGDSGARTVDD